MTSRVSPNRCPAFRPVAWGWRIFAGKGKDSSAYLVEGPQGLVFFRLPCANPQAAADQHECSRSTSFMSADS